MTDTIRWGIISTGGIAGKMADALKRLEGEGAHLLAVGSRTQESADAFGDRYGIPRRYASYEALAQDPDVDVIYVATPHPFHHDNTLLCLDHGKAVLCEKPFAMTARETIDMIESARAKGLFLMEAMWTRYLPVMVRVRELLREGVIGEPRLLTADFGFRAPFDPYHRLFAPELGGGALLDVGIYPVSFASMVMGTPESVYSVARLGETGVDEETAILFGYSNGAMAQLSAATRLNTPVEAVINGTEGRIKIHTHFFMGDTLTLARGGMIEPRSEETFTYETNENGFVYQAREVMACLRAGALESAIMPLDETLSIMRTMDAIMAQW